MWRALQGSAALAVLAFAWGAQSHAEEPRVPEGFFGINGQGRYLGDYPDPELDRAAAGIRSLGIERVRYDISWAVVEYGAQRPAEPDWSRVDAVALALARNGITMDPFSNFTPQWARNSACQASLSDPDQQKRCKPRSPTEYAAFTRAIVEKYGRNGTFWRDHPEVIPRPVQSVEIWNEPNFTLSFQPGPDPELYGRMYREARAAVRQVDPQIVTIVGGLASGTSSIMELEPFLEAMGEPESIDAIAMHTYGVTSETTVSGPVQLRAWMDAHGLQDQLIHFNEWGASTKGFDGLAYPGGQLTENDRAALFSEVTSQLARSDCGLAQVTPYTWETNYVDQGFEDWVGIARTGASTVLSPTAMGYRDMIGRLRGWQLPRAPRATVHLCNRAAPDADRDGVEDQHDYAPLKTEVIDAPSPSLPSSYEAPVLRGELRPGGTIIASPGTWDGSPHPTFAVERWEHCNTNLDGCSTITGATGWQLVPDSSIVGRRLRAVIRATNDHGSATAASAGDAAPAPVAPPTISGRPRVNETLYAFRGEWTAFPTPTDWYQWFTCNSNGTGCAPITGATSYSWKIPATALGKVIYVTVTAQNVWGVYTQVSARVGPVTLL